MRNTSTGMIKKYTKKKLDFRNFQKMKFNSKSKIVNKTLINVNL